MTGLTIVSSTQTPHDRARDLLVQIASKLGIDASYFLQSRRPGVEPTPASQSEIAELILAFSRIPDARGRRLVARFAESLASDSGVPKERSRAGNEID